MKTISVINNKGGVGKTTTTINLGYEFSQRFNKRVLLVDLDPQANLSKFFGAYDVPTIAHVLGGGLNIREIIQQTKYKNLDIVPSSKELKEIDDTLSTPGGDLVLRGELEAIQENYDFCIIDNAPALNIISDNAMIASDEIIVPICIDTFGFWGLDNIMQDIERARQVNPSLYFDGCLITRYIKDEISQDVERQMKEQNTYPVFNTHIRESKTMRRANFSGQPIVQNSLLSGASVDYRLWAKEYIENNLCS